MRRIKIYIAIILILAPLTQATARSTFSGERLEKACVDYIYSKLGSDVEAALHSRIADQAFDEAGVIAKIIGPVESLRGFCSISIEFSKNGRLIRRIDAPARVKIYRSVPTANANLRAGSAIVRSDFVLKKVDITQFEPDEILDYKELLGMKLKRSVAKGRVITKFDLQEDILVKNGERVAIVVESGAVRIRASGYALQSGQAGEFVKVRRDGSRTVVSGVVAEDGSVLISK